MRFLWRVYFWIFVVVILVVCLYEGFPSVWNIIDLALTIAAGVGLFLFAFERVLLNAGFWKVYGLLFIVYKVVLNALPFLVSWVSPDEPRMYLFSYPLFAALILYAFEFEKIVAWRELVRSVENPHPAETENEEEKENVVEEPDTQPETTLRPLWRRNQLTGIILAIFLGPLAWLYTYRRDVWKATLGAAVVANAWVNSVAFSFFYFRTDWFQDPMPLSEIFTNIMAYAVLIFLVPLWIWAIVSMFRAKQWEIYTPETRRQTTSIMLAVFLGPWTWLYTYKKDKWKFWVSILVVFGINIFISVIEEAGYAKVLGPMTAIDILRLVIPAIYVVAIVLAALRSREWYERYGEPDTAGYPTAMEGAG